MPISHREWVILVQKKVCHLSCFCLRYLSRICNLPEPGDHHIFDSPNMGEPDTFFFSRTLRRHEIIPQCHDAVSTIYEPLMLSAKLVEAGEEAAMKVVQRSKKWLDSRIETWPGALLPMLNLHSVSHQESRVFPSEAGCGILLCQILLGRSMGES